MACTETNGTTTLRRIAAALMLAGVGLASTTSAAPSPPTASESQRMATVTVLQDDQDRTALRIACPSTLQSFNRDAIGSEADDGRTESVLAIPGWPELPMVSRLVVVPPASGVTLKIRRVASHTMIGRAPLIAPVQDGSADLSIARDPTDVYLNTQGFWPPEAVTVGEPAIMRGCRMVPVTVYPEQYDRATGETRINDQVDFELEYGGAGHNIVASPGRVRLTDTFRELIETGVVNPPRRDSEQRAPDRGSMLIIYPDTRGVEEAIQPLVEWRARQGWEVHTQKVRNNASTNSVKDYIQEAYDNWSNPVEMVTLIGDADGNVSLQAYDPVNFGNDLDFVRLDGDDILQDAHIGRISVDGVNILKDVVAKLVNYEADPYMDDTTWYHSGMVCAGNAASGLSTILVNRWVARELTERGIDDIHEWYFDKAYQNQDVPTFFAEEFDRGIAFSNYRGYLGIENTSYYTIMGFQEHRQYPVSVTLTCGSGNYAGNQDSQAEAFLRSDGGAIDGIGMCTSSTHVQYNNAVAGGIWVGLLKQGHHLLGPSVTYGRFELYRQYAGILDAKVDNFSHWTAFFGDPATHVWTGVPQLFKVSHVGTLALGGSMAAVVVNDAASGKPHPHAVITLYKGDDGFQETLYGDAEGKATFNIPAYLLTEGELLVTVTDHNMKPYLGSISVAAAEYYLGAGSWSIDDGNDGVPNPGEAVEMTVNLVNFGANPPAGALRLTATSLSPWAKVTSDPIDLESAPASNDSAAVKVAVTIDDSAPNGAPILISLETAADAGEWSSVAVFEVVAPKLEIANVKLQGGELRPGDVINLDIQFANVGGERIGPFQARIFSKSNAVSFPEDAANYAALEPNKAGWANGSPFRVRGHPLAIPGMMAAFQAAVRSEDGFRDTASYVIQVGKAGDGTPFGPDKYGYVCFDSGDEGWDVAPVYDWVEIDPGVEGRLFAGDTVKIRDMAEDQDQSAVVDLPFDFQYYGKIFNQLTICTNGWAALGNWVKFTDFRNRRIKSGEGPNCQLAVFWDNLIFGYKNKIWSGYDEQGGRFIVEWNGLDRLWGGNAGHPEIFELILYSAAAQPTYSGDGIILYQYKSVKNASGNDDINNDTPYATVGIGSPDDLDGLEYTYWNEYTPGAKPLEDGMAIKFTTASQYVTGILTGTVTDVATAAPIAGALVVTKRGFWAKTNALGRYIISDILIGDDYWITAHKQGYNDSTLAGPDGNGFAITEGETTRVDYALLHAEFTPDKNRFDLVIPPDSTLPTGFTITNGGNGPLTFRSKYVYVLGQDGMPGGTGGTGPLRRAGRDESDETWDQLLGWNVTDATGNYRINGVAYLDGQWLVSGANRSTGDNKDHYFYAYDRWGDYIGQSVQPHTGGRGILDMKVYDGEIYGATGRDYFVRMTPDGNRITGRWETTNQVGGTQTIAVSDEGHVFTSTVSSDIFEYELLDDSTATVIGHREIIDPRDNSTIYKYGLAWFRDDPDHHPLYILGRPDPNDPGAAIFKADPQTGDVMFLTDLNLPAGQYRGLGMSVTPKWDNLVWVLAVVFDHADGDQIGVFELAPNSSWIDYSPREGTLQTGESQSVDMRISTADLDSGETYGVVIRYDHNADDGVMDLPVSLTVDHPSDINAREPSLSEYSLEQNRPNPFNPATTIGYSLREAGKVRLRLYDLMGRQVVKLMDGYQRAGSHHITFNAAAFPAGVYIYRLQSGQFTTAKKMVLIK